MPTITRLPTIIRPTSDLPDPTQRVVLLRESLRVVTVLVTVVAAGGLALGLGVLAALDGLSADPGGAITIAALALVLLGVDWRHQRRRLEAAEPVQPPVSLTHVKPNLGPRLLGAGVAVVLALLAFGWLLDSTVLLAAFVASVPARFAALVGLVALQERREGRRYLERLDLPDDEDLLHATPETVAALDTA